jgi:hypothetical protein
MQSSVESGEFGKRLIVREFWNDSLEERASDEQVAELVLATMQHGWSGNSVGFLARLPWLKVLEIDHLTIDDISPINCLDELVVMRLNTPRARLVPDFSLLRNLRMLVLAYWMPGSESAFNCVNLERLLVYKYPYEDVTPLSRLTKLDSLSFLNTYRLKSVRGISALQNMEYLGFFLCPKLTDIAQVAELKKIKELAFDTCKKARPFDVVGALKELRSLAFNNCGPIESIAALRNTPKLEEFLFWESTNVLDGDLSAMASLSKLRCHAFRERKHYSHNRSYFDQRGATERGRGGPRKRFGTFPDPNYEPLMPQG